METQMQMFNGHDHEIWSIKMKTLLMARDLWHVVEYGPYKQDLIIKDMTALHMLQTSVTESVFLRIGKATSSKQAWELLKADFGETKLISGQKWITADLECNLLVMKEEENVHEFIEKFMEIISRKKFYGSIYPDSVYISKLLSTLPSRFDEIVGDIRSKDKFTLPEVLCILRETECLNELEKCYSNNKKGRR